MLLKRLDETEDANHRRIEYTTIYKMKINSSRKSRFNNDCLQRNICPGKISILFYYQDKSTIVEISR